MAESKGGNMHEGMSNKAPKGEDSSMECKGQSVDTNSTRTKPAPTPKSLGGRTA